MSNSGKRIALDNVRDDIISGLPRHIIDSILEHLPVRDAARTSLLSRKWRYIWSEHPQLVIDKQFFQENIRNKPPLGDTFVRIISKILFLHNGPILKFILYIPNTVYDWDLHVCHWLLFLSRNGVKELTLDNRNVDPYKLPSYVFSCPELTYLELRNCIFKPPHPFGVFCKLVTLHFVKIAFGSNIFENVVLSAPLLERLRFISCTGIEHFNVHAPKLETFFCYRSCDVTTICFESFPNLTLLSILPDTEAGNPGQGRAINLSKFLVNLPRISNLRFDGFFLKLLAAGTIPRRLSITFNHLKHLLLFKLRFDDLDQMSCALCLLKSSPNLRKVHILAFPVGDNSMEPDSSYLEALDCMDQMPNKLRTVIISYINDLSAELLFIKCILACSPLLEIMLVEYNEKVGADKGFKISEELMQFSRASPKAKIVYRSGKPNRKFA